ncbi:hypothetical protein BGZ65_003954 [Modicella reniformis]|uniref:Chromo domain-containing protein n=1 Tax=Modicella reniformis TaxID=1440133 RepID=A0A9P6MHQ8_9FUNG|nr:hypothetical protein BGZ65_003954 [Modicella reniformis]
MDHMTLTTNARPFNAARSSILFTSIRLLMALASYITTLMSPRSNLTAAAANSTSTTDATTVAPGNSTSDPNAPSEAQEGNSIDMNVETDDSRSMISVSENQQGPGAEDASDISTLHKGDNNNDDDDDNMRTFLSSALPVGTEMSDETLSGLARVFHKMVRESSEAAAFKALSSFRHSPSTSIVPGSKRSASKPLSSPKETASTKRPKGNPGARAPLKIQKPAAEVGQGKAAVAKVASKGLRARASRVQPSTRATRASVWDDVDDNDMETDDRGLDELDESKDVSSVEEEEIDDADEEDEVYEVHSILRHRTLPGQDVEFRIWWKGYPKTQSTWEGKSALSGCQDLLNEYVQKHHLKL